MHVLTVSIISQHIIEMSMSGKTFSFQDFLSALTQQHCLILFYLFISEINISELFKTFHNRIRRVFVLITFTEDMIHPFVQCNSTLLCFPNIPLLHSSSCKAMILTWNITVIKFWKAYLETWSYKLVISKNCVATDQMIFDNIKKCSISITAIWSWLLQTNGNI